MDEALTPLCALWLGGGLMVFALAFSCSVLLAGEYTALIVAFLGLFAVPLLAVAIEVTQRQDF